jgi:hypothetical protein
MEPIITVVMGVFIHLVNTMNNTFATMSPKTIRFSLIKNVDGDFFLATATKVISNFKFYTIDLSINRLNLLPIKFNFFLVNSFY